MKNQALESFQFTLKTEMKSYRDVEASKNSPVSPQVIVKAVKEAVQTEDRGRNVILYGVKEDDEGDTEAIVHNVFSTIGEKPNISACTRLGKGKEGSPRPIKVCVGNSDTAIRLQKSGRRLKDNVVTRQIFVAPD